MMEFLNKGAQKVRFIENNVKLYKVGKHTEEQRGAKIAMTGSSKNCCCCCNTSTEGDDESAQTRRNTSHTGGKTQPET